VALVRGFARRRSPAIGNFWIDLTRGTLYVLLPICVLAALFLISQGVPQTLAPSIEVTTLEGATQMIARGPVASQEAIKLLSGDGGGFFNVNSAHPFENPSPLTNFAELLLIFVLGAALTARAKHAPTRSCRTLRIIATCGGMMVSSCVVVVLTRRMFRCLCHSNPTGR
jgi:K+-transporting ATPase ATPase A chain